MTNLIQIQAQIQNQTQTMSSREIAALTDKEHRNVCRDIENLNAEYDKLSLLKIEQCDYVADNGQTYREFLLTKEQTIDLITGYRADLRIRINRRWQELEKANQIAQIPQTYPDALRAYADEMEKRLALDTTAQKGYDNGTTKSNGGYPHPLSCVFLCPVHSPLVIYDGSREPNTTPNLGNKLRRPLAVVEARRPMPTKHSAISNSTNLMETAMSNTLILADTTIGMLGNLYSLNDLHKASGGADKHKPSNFMRNAEVQELIEEIEQSSNLSLEEKSMAYDTIHGGANRGTYVCKELVYRYAMWISPKFSLMVIRAFDAMTQGEFIPCTQVAPAQQPQSPRLSAKDFQDLRHIVAQMAGCFSRPNAVVAVIYARLRALCEVDSIRELRYEHLGLIKGELSRIDRVVMPYRRFRFDGELLLMRRVCMGDDGAVWDAMHHLDTASTDYAMNTCDVFSHGKFIRKLGGV